MRYLQSAKVRRGFSALLLFVVFGIGLGYLVTHYDDLRHVLSLDPRALVLLIILDLLFICLNGLRIKVLTEIFGVRLQIMEWLGLAATNSLLNYLPAQGGTITRGAYLKRAHSLPLSAFAASVGASYIVTFVSSGIIGLIALGGVFLTTGQTSTLLAVILAALILIGAGATSLRWPRWLPADVPVLSRMHAIWLEWRTIRTDHETIRRLIILDFLDAVTYACRLLISFQMVSGQISFWAALAVSPLAMLSVVMSITPGALGIKEAIVGGAATVFGASIAQGIQAATLDRVIMIILMMGFGGIFSARLSHYLEQPTTIEEK